ncbi:D-alanyl-D-alanine carboxypeptidase [Maritimibacter sp. DP4N28-5]|uniref:D-alanyl-D-alanine carboxypeptidase n=2 Tax=Maritimibacter dapengensis TaxID=2836868 RepID=A0ABS6SX21_9RHOB|nr:D-alanyl-D-alanine carboxypeptidase [Maritimibacter dapengensis]
MAAPYAAMVIDARSGEVIHSRNADTQLHPASLTKMMTLYIVFEAVKNGEIDLDSLVTISRKAASEPPSKIGFREGSQVRLRYLIRAAAVKSANDAATALGEAISGSEAAFARRMNRTAKALGMSRTHFKNMHGLTEAGHMSTARDMTTLGRHLFFDHPEYYNLFSRQSTEVGGKTVPNTNRRFLASYQGADGIKTGYTRAAGFNLVASAHRGNKRIITTVFGGQSTAARNAKVAELMNMGFKSVPERVAVRRPTPPPYLGNSGIGAGAPALVANGPDVLDEGGVGKTIRIVVAPTKSIHPKPRPKPEPILTAQMAAEVDEAVDAVLAEVAEAAAAETETETASTETTNEPAVVAEGSADPSAEVETIQVAEAGELPAPEPPAASAQSEQASVESGNAQVIAASMAAPKAAPPPPERPDGVILASVERAPEPAAGEPQVVTRMSTSGGRHWGINVGTYGSHYEAHRVLLKTALAELSTLGEALRKVSKSRQGFNANFVGMTKEGAELACRRLSARSSSCAVIEAGQG